MPCNSDFTAIHPELYRYTTFLGLKGIVETNTMWATHYCDLNDSTEVYHLKEALIQALAPRFDPILPMRNRQERRRLKAIGGSPQQIARYIVDALYRASYANQTSSSYVEAFIASFCTHADDSSYERANGLLSQWRAYGSDGYCLVFDAAALSDLLKQEWNYAHLLRIS